MGSPKPHPNLPRGAAAPSLDHSFISSETYRDLILATSGLTFSVFLHEVYFAGQPFDS